MTTTYLSIAGFIISIKYKEEKIKNARNSYFYKLVLQYYSNFIVPGSNKIDYSIEIESRTKIDVIIHKKEKSTYLLFYREIGENAVRTNYDIGVFQFQIILRKILQNLLTRNNGFVLHASSVGAYKKAVIFSGRSGAGKSTLVNILKDNFHALADDMVIVRCIKDEWLVFQTPFFEKNSWFYRGKRGFKLTALFLPRKSTEYRIESISDQEAKFQFLIRHFFSETDDLVAQTDTIQKFATSKVFFAKLYFGISNNKKVVELITNYAGKV